MNIKLLILGLLTATSLSAADVVLSPTIPAPTPPEILAKAANASTDELKKKSITAGTDVRIKEKSYQESALNTDNQKAATDALEALMASWKTLIMGSAPLSIKGADLDAIIKAAKDNGNNFTQANLDAFKAAYEAYSKELAAPGLDQFQISTGRGEYDAASKLAKTIQEELAAQKVAVEPVAPAAATSASAAPAPAATPAAPVPAPAVVKSSDKPVAATSAAPAPAATPTTPVPAPAAAKSAAKPAATSAAPAPAAAPTPAAAPKSAAKPAATQQPAAGKKKK